MKAQLPLSGLARISALFVDREFFMRSRGEVRFLRISAPLQRRIAALVVALVGGWLFLTLAMAVSQLYFVQQRTALDLEQKSVATAAEKVNRYHRSIDRVAADVEARQDLLDSLWQVNFGDEAVRPADADEKDALSGGDVSGDAVSTVAGARKISTRMPAAAGRLDAAAARQFAFAAQLTALATRRAEAAAREIRSFGLDPQYLARQSVSGKGGPLIALPRGSRSLMHDPRIALLVDRLGEMALLEQSLGAIPSSLPAPISSLSSGFGFRRDPFTGEGAMHAGLDFKGEYGSAITAAASGAVTFAGYHNGYGNCVEIDHGGGIMTRYAHLSRINVAPGDAVARDAMIGSMGSTGRSTGTHLHFEVRLNDRALNPAKFLNRSRHVR